MRVVVDDDGRYWPERPSRRHLICELWVMTAVAVVSMRLDAGNKRNNLRPPL